jgi:hypothetical protein
VKTPTIEETLSRLNPVYHEDFLQYSRERFHSGELILWVGNQSYGERLLAAAGSHFSIGYFVVTSNRLAKVNFPVDFGILSNWRRKTININETFFAAELPDKPLSRSEKENRTVFEQIVVDLKNVNHEEYKIRINGINRTIVAITGFYDPMFFEENDGNEAYKLLTELINPRERDGQNLPNLADLLEKLAELHRYQVLTDEEYEMFKLRLIGK